MEKTKQALINRVLELHNKGVKFNVISAQLNKPAIRVLDILADYYNDKYGPIEIISDKEQKEIKRKSNKAIAREKRNRKIVKEYLNGRKIVQLAIISNVSIQTIRNVLEANNVLVKKHAVRNISRLDKRLLKINRIKGAMLSGTSVHEIADTFNLTLKSVYTILKKMHLKWILPHPEEFIMEAWHDKQSSIHIAKMFNISISEVYSVLRDNNIPVGKKVTGNAEKRFLDIKSMYEQGKTYAEIATVHKMNPGSVWNLLRNRNVIGLKCEANYEKWASIIDLYNKDTSREELAKMFKTDVMHITSVLYKYGYRFKDRDRIEKIKAYFLSGKSIDEVAREFEIIRQRVIAILRCAGIPYETFYMIHNENILTLFREEIPIPEISKIMGVSPASIIVNLRRQGVISWNDVSLFKRKWIKIEYENGLKDINTLVKRYLADESLVKNIISGKVKAPSEFRKRNALVLQLLQEGKTIKETSNLLSINKNIIHHIIGADRKKKEKEKSIMLANETS